jgi:hypothetical protein
MDTELDFYATPGPMTILVGLDPALAGLPRDPAGVAEVVQGLMLHRFWSDAYGVVVPGEREEEIQLRSAASMINRIMGIDPLPLSERRPPEKRFLGNCLHFSILGVALLRRAGIPSRARCGFANYFEAGKWIDHWVVEYWNGERWVTLDAQIDQFQREALGLVVDTSDLPPGYFLVAGEAWAQCQAGAEDGDRFGILDMWGQWFIRGNIARDLAAMNKVEMLPWDGWGALAGNGTAHVDPAYVDDVASLTLSSDFAAIRHRYETDELLQVPPRVKSLTNADGIEVDIPELAGSTPHIMDAPPGH